MNKDPFPAAIFILGLGVIVCAALILVLPILLGHK